MSLIEEYDLKEIKKESRRWLIRTKQPEPILVSADQ